MKATLSSSATAAALLLGSLGAVLASHPAAAQDWTGYARPAVVAPQDFRGDHDRWDQHDHRYRRDDRGPVVSDVTPAHGDRVGDRGLTRISAHFSDDRSGVDLRFLVLRVDGRDVTHRARVDADDIRYAEDLRPGRHVAELVVRDRAGNVTRRAWSFDVVERGRNYGYNNSHHNGYTNNYNDGYNYGYNYGR